MSYYDLTITRIPFGWSGIPERRADLPHDWLPVQCWAWDVSRWLEWWKYYGPDGNGCLCYVKIEDNGVHGDGIKFGIYAGDDKNPIAETGIPDDSLDSLIEALRAVKKLREATTSGG